MRIDSISLTNFMNFRKLSLEFGKGINLFVGGNGNGKTAILNAVNVAAGAFFGSQENALQRRIDFSEIGIYAGLREDLATIQANFHRKGEIVEWSRTIKTETKNNDSKNVKPISEWGATFFNAFKDPNDRTVCPIISYYSTQRLFRDSSLSEKQKYDPAIGRKNGFLNCLSPLAIKDVLNEWIGNEVTKRATFQIKEIEYSENTLPIVEEATTQTLRYLNEMEEGTQLKIYQDPHFDNQLYINYGGNNNLPLSYYSDGFRNVLYLIMDIAWRASQLNPWLNFEGLKENLSGVITIDEIDLHLHPKWQSKVIELLSSLFPNVQFFITTHSPIIVSNFEKGNLYLIDSGEINLVHDHYFGKEVNYILHNILGATERHKPTQIKLDKLFSLIDNAKYQEASALINDLKSILGNNDADLFRAQSLLNWEMNK